MGIIIYTNDNNIQTLKIIIAANYYGSEVKIEIANPQEKRELPYFTINNTALFSSNAGLLYFNPSDEQSRLKLLYLLEWESTVLSPILTQLAYSKDKQIKEKLMLCIQKLHTLLEGNQYLVENNFSIVDIALWSVLYPLVKCSTLYKEYIEKNANVMKWWTNLSQQSSFKKSREQYPVKAEMSTYESIFKHSKPLNFDFNNQLNSEEVEVTLEELNAATKSWNKTYDKSSEPKAKPVLPVKGKKNILITSALPYVNNVPHLGNIIGCVLSADVFARFSRLCDHNTLFICGTDEYGTATETKALEEGLTCRQICDKYFKIHEDIYQWFNISFDNFGRTSTPEQTELCQDMFLQLNDNGFMFTDSVQQLFCEKCQRFLADRFVEGGCPNIGCTYEDARGDQCDGCGKLVNAIELKNPRCKMCKNSPKIKVSSQFFMDLPKLEPLLLHWFKKSSDGWSANAQTIARSWLREGLKPRCITRDLKWGIPVPLKGFEDKVFYVWFDAPIGYMSITKNYTDRWEEWWKPKQGVDVVLYNFMAKDNVPFHSIMFPATLLGTNRGYVTVSHLMATEYLNYEDGKFSKSRGAGVFGNDARSTGISSDVWRFYLLFIRPESQDSNFNWLDLATKNNSELLNNLGNFVNRALMFAKSSFGKRVPKMIPIEDDYSFLALCTRELKSYVASLEKAKLKDGLRCILAISKLGNQYMQSHQPWALLKGTEEEKVRAGTVVGISCNIVCLLSIILSPYMPEASEKIKNQLNCRSFLLNPDAIEIVNLLPEGHTLGDPSPLFTKIENEKIEELKHKYGGKQENGKKVVQLNSTVPIEVQVAAQADKVRKLKEGGADKSIWKPEVDVLLQLKALLNENAKKPNEKDVKALEEEVAKQAGIVRSLKEGGKEKSLWQPEVDKLLVLKSKLAQLTGSSLATSKGKKGKK